MVEMSVTRQLFSRMLSTYYIPLEIWYTRTVIDKVSSSLELCDDLVVLIAPQAHQLSRVDVSQSPAVTTTPDDVFYILKSIMTRILSTGSTTVVENMVSSLRDIIDRDYAQVLKRKLDDVYKLNGPGSAVAKADRAERDNRQSFIVCTTSYLS